MLLILEQVAASVSGGIVGPFLWAPLAQRVGRCSLILSGTLLTLCFNIWSATMTNESQYIAFIMSRWLAGIFSTAALTLGAGMILELFYLHQRGKAFAAYAISSMFGVILAPVLSGFIIEYSSWTLQFWWCVAGLGVALILTFLFLEDTTFTREDESTRLPEMSYLSNRVATFFPGNKILQTREKDSYLTVWMIFISPIALMVGTALCLIFSWQVGLNIVVTIFLQTPVEEGGYGFTGGQNSEFLFCQWVALALAEVYGFVLNDRSALWMCRRRGGVWKPEYRLFPVMILPCIAAPVGLILFGVGIQYHLHYMVLATGFFLSSWADLALVPVLTTYLAEVFRGYASETYTALWAWRLSLGVVIPFFLNGWLARHGPAWCFGTMAIIAAAGTGILFTLVAKGHTLRRLLHTRYMQDEEGEKVVANEKDISIETI